MVSPRVSYRSGNSAFTLIEILIVVAIAGILAALIFPAINRGIYGAKVAGCASNLHQIGLGFRGYLSDHNNVFPPDSDPITGESWGAQLLNAGYLSDSRVLKCPGDTINRVLPDLSTGKSMARSYAYCSPIMTGGTYSPYGTLQALTLNSPSRQYLLTEWHSTDNRWDQYGCSIAGWDIASAGSVSPSHVNGSRNCLYVDGHVGFASTNILSDPRSGWQANDLFP